jgi:NADH:ubiquinone oxidoreductase subunit H
MGLAWKVLLPLALFNIFITALLRIIANGQLF